MPHGQEKMEEIKQAKIPFSLLPAGVMHVTASIQVMTDKTELSDSKKDLLI